MANDPLSEITALQSSYDSLYTAAVTFANEVAAAQPNPTSDFATADVQAALTAFASDVASKPVPTNATVTPSPAVTAAATVNPAQSTSGTTSAS